MRVWIARIHEFNGLCLVFACVCFLFTSLKKKEKTFLSIECSFCVKKRKTIFQTQLAMLGVTVGICMRRRKKIEKEYSDNQNKKNDEKKNCNVRKWHLIQIKIQLAHYTRQWLQNKTGKKKTKKKGSIIKESPSTNISIFGY